MSALSTFCCQTQRLLLPDHLCVCVGFSGEIDADTISMRLSGFVAHQDILGIGCLAKKLWRVLREVAKAESCPPLLLATPARNPPKSSSR